MLNGGEPQLKKENWKVFALLEMDNKQRLVLHKGSEILYQVCIFYGAHG